MTSCQVQGCKLEVPAALDESALCVHHFLLWLDGNCAAMRRETASGVTAERHDQIAEFIRDQGERLSHVATSGHRLSDDMKSRVLNEFLSLMNLRENLERGMERAAKARPVP